MTKKSIADLLKEEVEKPSSETAVGKAAKASTSKASAVKTATAKTTTAKTTTAKTPTPKTGAKATSKPASTAKSAAKNSSHSTALVNVNLEKEIAELNIALKKANEQISALQEDIDTHQARIFELKDSLITAESSGQKKDTQLKKLSTDLDAAKQTILKLTEAAQTAQETSAAAEKAQQAADAARKEADKKADAQKASTQAARSKSLTLQQRKPYSSYKSIPEYAIQRGTPPAGQNNSMLNDDDIGWVD